MELLMDPSIWAGLLTLIVLEIVLGIDNLVFIAILADKLPPKQRDKARLIGLSLALVMRLGLLSVISWMVTLTKPLITIADFSFSGRDLIMLLGGIFLLFKATTELHERLENRQHDAGHGKGYASFWVVVLQIVVLDAVFSLDAVITAVGMVNHLPVMMAAVVIAMILMLLASKPLTRFVNQHPTVVVLCLSFLLMIGLSLVAEGFGFHIPKGYLYAAIGFSIIIEFFNQVARRNFVRHQSTLPLRARTADAILRLMGGRKQASVSHDADSPAAVPVPEGAFAEEERYMINGVLTLAQRSLRSIMTRAEKSAGSTLSRVKMKFVVSCCRRRTASSRSAAESWMKSLVSCGRKRCWWPWSRGKTSRRWLLPPRQLSFRKRWTRSICSGSCVGRAAASSS
ncbi:magnesium and cobalt efflux protein CorC [Klebsiella pneumoniae]|uniref:Magnesium and cobalt efflux protein CorC n=1 Tax=Klebsiella pneumoniae TaxID=573 RepID=A0A378BUS0_KLEPN|nr:magnesium and cobalt efflux protein CorC [Klebsiella pneumoniae]